MILYLGRPCRCGLNSFNTKRKDIFWYNKDLRRRGKRVASINLEAFYRVLPLLVEMYGRLLLPLEKSYNSSNSLSKEDKETPYCSKNFNLG